MKKLLEAECTGALTSALKINGHLGVGRRQAAQSKEAEQDSRLSSTRLPDLEGQVVASFLPNHVSEKEPLAKCMSVSSTVGLSLSALFPVETRILPAEGSGGQAGSVT